MASTDPGTTSRFFRELLGWEIAERANGYTSFTDGRLTGGFPDLVHGFAPVRRVLAAGDVVPYVETDDLDDALVRARGLGGEVLLAPTEAAPGHWLAVVRAPGGAKLALTRIERP
ncbi:VOC family protein [Cellulomonas sp. APG4]|uniref:VOC family protein n=1 Tax=Cellulomonas sp. APG4 TaxID=1538656 RepID=UPI00351B9920